MKPEEKFDIVLIISKIEVRGYCYKFVKTRGSCTDWAVFYYSLENNELIDYEPFTLREDAEIFWDYYRGSLGSYESVLSKRDLRFSTPSGFFNKSLDKCTISYERH